MKYYKIYKPYGMISQFSGVEKETTLRNLHDFQKDVYPVGRLDADSEGLLILTNDKRLNSMLLGPSSGTEKEYLVQVEGIPSEKDIIPLREGVIIEKIRTLPAQAEIILSPDLPSRTPPIRFRKNIPDTWLRIVITEGRNRQIRKMTAKIGFPTLRLVRIRFKNIVLQGMNPGDVKELNEIELIELLK